jgi:protoporphyrinogen oxidase
MRITIVGAGIAGLFAALVVKSIKPDAVVTIIESEKNFGGLLSGLRHDGVHFDTGVHTFYETGNSHVDTLLFSVVPTGGWNKLSGLTRDLGGIFQDGNLNLGNTYFNFLNLEQYELEALQESFLKNFSSSKDLDYRNAYSYLESRFGSDLVNKGLSQYITKFTGSDPQAISTSVVSILPLSRVNLFAEELHEARVSDSEWNSRISYPNQRRLPESIVPSRSAYYPSNYGTALYIDALVTNLKSLGVVFEKDSKVLSLSQSKLSTADGVDYEFDLCLWATHPIVLTKLMGLFFRADLKKNDAIPMRTAIASYLLKNEPTMGDLYYAYDATPGHLTHRFSSPINFCSKSKVGDLFRFTNEVVYHTELSHIQIREKSTQELLEMGIFKFEDIESCYVSKISNGYPNLNAESSASLQEYLGVTLKNLPSSILPIGIMSEPNLFFQNDVLVNVYNKLQEILV